MIARRARGYGLIDPAPAAAVDATGLESRHVSRYFRWRRGTGGRRWGRRQRAWPKLTCVWHVGSHLILGAVPNTGPTQDSPDFAPAVRQATRLLRLDTVLADGAYDAEHHHALCRERLGVREVVIPANPRGTGRRWPMSPYRRAAKRRWARELRAVYGARWHAESGFSRHKRRLGSALTARRPASQRRQLILRVLTHNLMILARRAHRFSTEQAVHTWTARDFGWRKLVRGRRLDGVGGTYRRRRMAATRGAFPLYPCSLKSVRRYRLPVHGGVCSTG